MSAKSKRAPVWTPFVACDEVSYDGGKTYVPLPEHHRFFKNSLYAVTLRVWPETGAFHLSIRRNDRGHLCDWRHFQRIKNELVGREVEAVELYPAESRLVDEANQFHLWGVRDASYRFPFGWPKRLVSDGPPPPDAPRSRQRPIGDDR